MSGHGRSRLEDNIAILQNEAPEVLRAIENLNREIYDGINDYQLKNGSHIRITALNKLNPNQRQRVLENFVGRFYERESTHHQYKIVLDPNDSKLTVISAEISQEHFCFHQTK